MYIYFSRKRCIEFVFRGILVAFETPRAQERHVHGLRNASECNTDCYRCHCVARNESMGAFHVSPKASVRAEGVAMRSSPRLPVAAFYNPVVLSGSIRCSGVMPDGLVLLFAPCIILCLLSSRLGLPHTSLQCALSRDEPSIPTHGRNLPGAPHNEVVTKPSYCAHAETSSIPPSIRKRGLLYLVSVSLNNRCRCARLLLRLQTAPPFPAVRILCAPSPSAYMFVCIFVFVCIHLFISYVVRSYSSVYFVITPSALTRYRGILIVYCIHMECQA